LYKLSSARGNDRELCFFVAVFVCACPSSYRGTAQRTAVDGCPFLLAFFSSDIVDRRFFDSILIFFVHLLPPFVAVSFVLFCFVLFCVVASALDCTLHLLDIVA
jgi:hypothetical protein